MKIRLTDLRDKVNAGIQKLGYDGEDAKIIADTLLYAQLRGNNQGIAKLATGGVPKAIDIEPFALVKEHKSGALFSGGHAMVASVRAADKAVELAKVHGVGVVASNLLAILPDILPRRGTLVSFVWAMEIGQLLHRLALPNLNLALIR